MLEFSCLEVDSGSNVEDGWRPRRCRLQQSRQEKGAPHENMGLESTRDLAVNICMPAGCVTLFVPCPENQKPCQPKREGSGENVWLHSSKRQYSHTLLNNRVAL